MALLGIDYGTKRVGVALADGGRPRPLPAVPGGEDAIGTIGALVARYNASTVVVGLPRNLDGDDTPQTALTRKFAAKLQALLGTVPVVLQDEADTSNAAQERLRSRGVHARDIPAQLDSEAATIILEDYLNEQ